MIRTVVGNTSNLDDVSTSVGGAYCDSTFKSIHENRSRNDRIFRIMVPNFFQNPFWLCAVENCDFYNLCVKYFSLLENIVVMYKVCKTMESTATTIPHLTPTAMFTNENFHSEAEVSHCHIENAILTKKFMDRII